MPIVTLTSDLGDGSHYAAIVKGVILSLFPGVQLVDVTHNISDFDLMQAAYVVKHMYAAFPVGTIHLIAVDPEHGKTETGIVVEHDGHYFIGPNNGVLSLVCGGTHVPCR
ncbi:MAG: SAM-dependent chlorinase/fluorinase, partial [Bacteroidota bacterium]